MREHRYVFESCWSVPASPQRCWAAIERMLTPGGASWWPGISVSEFPGRLAAGEELALAVRSPFGYRLRVRLRLDDVVPVRRATAASTGDLVGTGLVEVDADGAGSRIVVRWDVQTRTPWMNRSAGVLRPVFVLAHSLVMRAGERGLRRAVG